MPGRSIRRLCDCVQGLHVRCAALTVRKPSLTERWRGRRALACVLGLLTVGATEEGNLDQQLRQAKMLYTEALFAEAAVKLEALAARFEALQETTSRNQRLSETYLFAGLSYIGLDDRPAAKAAFERLIRIDPARRLDPEVYASKVLQLFEEARAELVAGRARRPDRGETETEPTAKTKKKRPTVALALVGVGGAILGGLALAGDGGTASPQAAPTTSPDAACPTFTVGQVPPGVLYPVWVGPPRGATLSGVVLLQCRPGQGMPTSCVARIEYFESAALSRAPLNPIGVSSGFPWVVSWDSTTVANGNRDVLCRVVPPSEFLVSTANQVTIANR